jgi:hypothetical protein
LRHLVVKFIATSVLQQLIYPTVHSLC